MRLNLQQFSVRLPNEILPKSTVKIFRSTKNQQTKSMEKSKHKQKQIEPDLEFRQNEMNIQMLSRSLFKQIFDVKDCKAVDAKIAER